MSDRVVAAVLDDLERLLASMTDDPRPEDIAAWNQAFRKALAGAERGPQWPALVSRAQDLGGRLQQQTNHLQAIRGAVREELLSRAKGRRALRGYMPS